MYAHFLKILSALTLFIPIAGMADPAAEALAAAIHARPSGRDLTIVSRMELVSKAKAPPRVREFVSYRLERGADGAATLVRFTAPEDIAGTGLLSLERADGSTDQHLYLPELDRVRRISGDRQRGRFVGSDLYYEDLQDRKPSKDRHRIIGQEPLNGVACEVLESVPVDPGDSAYRKRLQWVDPQTLLVLRVDYFEQGDQRPSKRWLAEAQRRVQGYWTVTDSRMIDLESGHETRIVAVTVKYDRKLPSRLFTPQSLADEQIELEFRP